uniref:Uncharacterized protein n=1 Tax=Oryza meridionalis TaxID=40149 RepID=A0A0E0FA00_9ORYZ
MEKGNDREKPDAHDQNSIGGHLAPSSLFSVELKHCAGATSSTGTGTTSGSAPAQACGSCCAPSGRAIAISRHLVLALCKGNTGFKD